MDLTRKRPDRWGPVSGGDAYLAALSKLYSSVPAPLNEAISRGPGDYRLACPECHKGPRDSALSVTVEPGSTAVWKCWRCNWTGSTRSRTSDVVRTGPTKKRDTKAEEAKAREKLRKLWRESEPLDLDHHKAVLTYLEARGLHGVAGDPPADIRFIPALDYWTKDDNDRPMKLGAWPALLAVVRDPDGRPVTLHRTYLAADGSSKADVPAPRKLCSTGHRGALDGAAVRLYPATNRLALAEGMETALAVRLAGGWPVWSTVSAGGLRKVVLPDSVRDVLVAADFDPAGIDASEALARRLTAEGRHVRVAIPDSPGTDWADEMSKEAA